ncbi:MAG: hypothetical protein ABJC74_13005 [Gemmatimonadota bacterium]
MFIRVAWLLLLAWGTPLAAQLEQVGVPRGQMRVEIGGSFDNWSQRFFDGGSQDWNADFSSDSLGSNRIPELGTSEGVLGRLLGQSNFRLSIGSTQATELVNVGTLNLGLAIGLTSRLTVFGRIPMVRARAQPRVLFKGDSVGFNPASAVYGSSEGSLASQSFFSTFGQALDTLSGRFASGYYAGRSDSTLAAQTLASAMLLRARLDTLTRLESANSPFLPLEQSAAGQHIQSTITSLQGTLSTLQVAGFNDSLPLPTAALDQAAFEQFLGNPGGAVAARAPTETLYWYLGNVELGGSYSLIDRWDRNGGRGGLRLSARASLTLPTARLDQSFDFFDVGTGDPGYSVHGGLIADIGRNNWGARLEGDYIMRFASLRVRRIALPSQPYAYASRLANLRLKPGDDLSLSVQPFYRLTRAFALTAGGNYTRRGASSYSYYRAEDSIDHLDPAELAVDSKLSWISVNGGVTYTSRGVLQPGRGVPIEASWHYGQTVSGSGGRVPKSQFTDLTFRLYFSLWH